MLIQKQWRNELKQKHGYWGSSIKYQIGTKNCRMNFFFLTWSGWTIARKPKKKWENACWRIHAGVPFTGKQKNNISKRTIYIYTHVLKYEYVKQQKMIEIIIYNGCDSETICILTAPIHIIMLLLWCNLITTNFKPKLQ
jgi:hypothetical protein